MLLMTILLKSVAVRPSLAESLSEYVCVRVRASVFVCVCVCVCVCVS